MVMNSLFWAESGGQRLARLVARRRGEDERLVCMQRAKILQTAQETTAHMSRVERQAAVLRELCRRITPVIEPEDILVGRMPEVVPDEAGEAFIGRHPELFSEPGLPGCLDSMSIYVPDWTWLLGRGPGGIAQYALHQRDTADASEDERLFLTAIGHAMESLSCLIRRYAAEARRLAESEPSMERRAELEAVAARCERVAWSSPASFIEALQLIQIVHMVLSCLVGGRDVTLGRLDEYLWGYYRKDTESGEISKEDAVILLATFFLRLSQMGGKGTDFDDSVRRSPCRYTHLYVTVGGRDSQGRSCVNALSFAVADAIRTLNYKEPTLLVRYHTGMDRAFVEKVAGLARDRLPVTIYNDELVTKALVRQGVPAEMAHEYAHSACHNAIVPGHEAGSGPAFHNVPKLILLAMNAGRDPKSGQMLGAATADPGDIQTFEQFLDTLRAQMKHLLTGARRSAENWWERHLSDACPLLPSCLMKECLDRRAPAWRAATVSHWNHHLMGLATSVDSLLALRQLVFAERSLSLGEYVRILTNDWAGHEALRERLRKQQPRYGQDCEEGNGMASRLAWMWVEEVEAVSAGMARMAMWPGFYSHMVHVREGARTMATPDGRVAGDPLNENLAPSTGTPGCSPTSILKAMSGLPFDHTPSGAAILTLSQNSFSGGEGPGRLLWLLETYFAMGGLHLHVNILDAETLLAAMRTPERYLDLRVRVAGFSAYFVDLSRDVQLDVIRRHSPAS